MSVSGIGTTHYPIAGYETRKAESVVPQKPFSDVVSEKAIEKKDDINEKAFEYIAPNAPESVKQAWIEAAKEMGANGFGLLPNGMLSHISQLMVQSGIAWLKGETNFNDVLGNSVASAISSAQKALYDLDNPLEPNATRSIEVQQARNKEREFYIAFLEKLENL